MLELYDTEKRIKKPLMPEKGQPVRMYTCGPTVYNYAHIGNFRTYVFEDLLRRTIKYFGMSLKHVMNLTDVEDKTIKGAIEKKLSLNAYTKTYIDAFFEDLKTLKVEPADIYPRATEHVPEMIAIIETLMEKGAAYQSKEGNVYFSIRHFPSYGRLSHLNIDDLKVGASDRVSMDEYEKDAVSDFVLWKAYDKERDGEVYWESPFGKGRPGWHIECSAMAMKHLGPTVDLHVGGVDNIFPHHENEIAQSEACTEVHFAKHWMHAEHLIVNGKKMSKSLGNFYTLRDLLEKGYSGTEIRYLLLQTHYRTQLNFTLEGLDGARQALMRFEDFIYRLKHNETTTGKNIAAALITQTKERFKSALGDDLNISVALAALFDLVREVNLLLDGEKVSQAESHLILDFLKECDQVLAVLPFEEKALDVPQEVQDAFDRRQQARVDKNWQEADAMRDFIHSKGYLIEDTPSGPRLKSSTS